MACVPDNSPKSVILSTQTQCPECRYEIQSMLRKVQGVYSMSINADRNTITVSGNLAPKDLLQTLLKVSQDCDFCIKPPAHIPPSGCPANRSSCTSWPHVMHPPACSGHCGRPSNGIRVCSTTPAPVCCSCTQRNAASLSYRPCGGHGCHPSHYSHHGRY